MIKQYFLMSLPWFIGVLLFGILLSIGGCTNYHVEQNSNNGDTCKKGAGNYSIFGESCEIKKEK